ncbi:MAG: hypothetical protein ACOCQW_01040 [Halanaerobiaceae bacterium]
MIPQQQQFEKTVNQIINSTEYSHLRNYLRNLINNIKKSLTEWLYETLSNINWGVSPSISNNLSTIFIILACILVIAVIVLVVVSISGGFENKHRVREILGQKIDDKTTPDSLKEKSVHYKKMGENREAVRYSFIALLFLMHQEGIIYLDKAETNKEIYNQIKEKNFSGIKQFEELIKIFNSVWYGHKRCPEELYEIWDKNLNLLWNEVNGNEKT